ncbi:hypothetical protein HON36_03320 [Candidatus Parcubacteria bacterium]|jgi:hypothetical protein|nr:hypothetical protein [Candidatus Parcubacteria bacterium]
MTHKKRMLIKRAQGLIAKHHENLDWDTKVLYEKVRFLIQDMTPEQIAQAMLREMHRGSK